VLDFGTVGAQEIQNGDIDGASKAADELLTCRFGIATMFV